MKPIHLCLALALASSSVAVLATPAQALPPKHISGNQTIPVYSYASAIREVVWVESSVDSDLDTQLDRIAVDIVRPVDTTQPNLKVPAIIEASPYYTCFNQCGRGNELEKKTYANPNDPNSPIAKMPLYYDNYFVPRGYAFLGVDLSGSARSKGCADIGGSAEVLSAKAVVNWLNGTAKAFRANGTQAFASTWYSGSAGMIGKSWDGAIANGVAATGVPGLKTIVPIGGVSSWYDWDRYNAGVVAKVSHLPDLYDKVNSRGLVCKPTRDALVAGSSLNYNAFWASRDYIANAANVQASVFAVHGMHDTAVKSSEFGLWWERLAANNVPRKVWLAQTGHVDPFDFRRAEWVTTLHRWFDQWLQGLNTGIMNEPMATVERAANVWENTSSWPPVGTTDVVHSLGIGNGTTGDLTAGPGAGGFVAINDVSTSEPAGVHADPLVAKNGRFPLQSAPLAQPLHIAGSATIVLRVKMDKPTATLSARLVDYGPSTMVDFMNNQGVTTGLVEDCWGSPSAADDPCYKQVTKNLVQTQSKMLSRGWLNARHRFTLTATTDMTPGVWETIVFRLHATDQIIPAGHRLGLVLSSTDGFFTSTAATGAVIDVDLQRSLLRLPTAP